MGKNVIAGAAAPMFDQDDLLAAVRHGVISSETASRLQAFLDDRVDPEPGPLSENLRFLTNFHDVFITIGIVMLMTGVMFLAVSAAKSMSPLAGWIATVATLAIAWLLAEYFCGRRRLTLPSMALSVVICVATAVQVEIIIMKNPVPTVFGYAGFGASALAAIAIFWRFGLPFALFLLALSLAGIFYLASSWAESAGWAIEGSSALIAGLATLVAGIWIDTKDPSRQSLVADQAFWLHLAAAPQIMSGVRALVIGAGFSPAGTADATIMLVVLTLLSLLSLALDRRALIVSSLFWYGGALWVLATHFGAHRIDRLMLTALLLGMAVVSLGAGWRTARRFVLKGLPSRGVFKRIFPPEPC